MVLTILFSLAVAPPARAFAQEGTPAYFHPDNILEFADFLFSEGDFGPAVAEYRRYLMTDAGSVTERARVHFKVGLALRTMGESDAAAKAFASAAESDPAPVFATDCRLQIAYTYLAARRWDKADASLQAAAAGSPPARAPLLHSVQGARYLLARDWTRASDHFARSPDPPIADPLLAELQQIAKEGVALPRRSPWVGGLLSAIVPGSGRIYAGRKADGLLSALTISLTGWQAYRGFKRDGKESVRGWILGSIGAFMYVGNVYGSIVSVRLMNDQGPNTLIRRTELAVSVALR